MYIIISAVQNRRKKNRVQRGHKTNFRVVPGLHPIFKY